MSKFVLSGCFKQVPISEIDKEPIYKILKFFCPKYFYNGLGLMILFSENIGQSLNRDLSS